MSGMEYASMFLGVDIVLLDHLHFFIRQKDPEYERQAIDNFVRSITILTKKLKVHTFLICHPSKLYKTNAPVGMNDLKGSSEIKQDADNVISIWRDKEHENSQTGEYPMQIIFDKIRQDGFCEGKIGMLFNIGSNHYTGLSKENYKERFGK
jgi:replicative DNA helicase